MYPATRIRQDKTNVLFDVLAAFCYLSRDLRLSEAEAETETLFDVLASLPSSVSLFLSCVMF